MLVFVLDAKLLREIIFWEEFLLLLLRLLVFSNNSLSFLFGSFNIFMSEIKSFNRHWVIIWVLVKQLNTLLISSSNINLSNIKFWIFYLNK